MAGRLLDDPNAEFVEPEFEGDEILSNQADNDE